MEKVTVTGEGLERTLAGTAIVYRKWVKAPKNLRPGEAVEVREPGGGIVACALWEPLGPVALRILYHGPCPHRTPEELILERIESAYRAREASGLTATGSYRLVSSDGDLLSGLIVDVYAGEVAVIQSSSAALDAHLEWLAEAIARVTGVQAVYDKSTQRSRRDIGLEPRRGWLRGRRERVLIEEWGAKFIVDVVRGQKTGFYLDQRFNRLEFRRYVDPGDSVLDVFSYTGGFGIHAALEGAGRVVFIEEDPEALKILRENLRLNNIGNYEILEGSVWEKLPQEAGHGYNVIAVDPPAFIQQGDQESWRRGRAAYKRVYTMAAKAASEGSTLFLSSCSYFLTREEFIKVASEAMLEAGWRGYRFLGSLRGSAPDHTLRGEEYLDYLKASFIHLDS